MAFTIGEEEVRETTVDKIVKQTAAFTFKFRQSMAEETGGGWTEEFFRETQAILGGARGRTSLITARFAKPAEITPSWEQLQVTLGKHMADLAIPWEDRIRSDFNAFSRALVKSGEAVANSEDALVWSTIQGDSVIQTLSVVNAWNGLNPNPIKDFIDAQTQIGERPYNYPTGDLHVHVNIEDWGNIRKFLIDNGNSLPQVAEDTVRNRNGNQGTLGSFTFISNEAISVSQAFICVPNVWATLRIAEPLKTITTVDEMISIRIRSGLISVPKITDPKAAVRLTGTRI